MKNAFFLEDFLKNLKTPNLIKEEISSRPLWLNWLQELLFISILESTQWEKPIYLFQFTDTRSEKVHSQSRKIVESIIEGNAWKLGSLGHAGEKRPHNIPRGYNPSQIPIKILKIDCHAIAQHAAGPFSIFALMPMAVMVMVPVQRGSHTKEGPEKSWRIF